MGDSRAALPALVDEVRRFNHVRPSRQEELRTLQEATHAELQADEHRAPLAMAVRAALPEEGLVVADLDFALIDKRKRMMDSVGHYARPELLSLMLDNRPAEILVGDRVPIRVIDISSQPAGQTGPPRATVRFEQTGIVLAVGLVVLVVREEARLDAVPLEQLRRVAGVLAQHDVGLGQLA